MRRRGGEARRAAVIVWATVRSSRPAPAQVKGNRWQSADRPSPSRKPPNELGNPATLTPHRGWRPYRARKTGRSVEHVVGPERARGGSRARGAYTVAAAGLARPALSSAGRRPPLPLLITAGRAVADDRRARYIDAGVQCDGSGRDGASDVGQSTCAAMRRRGLPGSPAPSTHRRLVTRATAFAVAPASNWAASSLLPRPWLR